MSDWRPADSKQAFAHLDYWREAIPGTRFVYFIRAGRGGPVKVGKAKDPVGRMATLQTAQPQKLELLHVFPGWSKQEQQFHGWLAVHRLNGEWFDAAGTRDFVARMYEVTELAIEHFEATSEVPDVERLLSSVEQDRLKAEHDQMMASFDGSEERAIKRLHAIGAHEAARLRARNCI